MSRYHSPYAARRSAPRWPWLFGALAVAALLAAGSILLQGNLFEASGVSLGPPGGGDDGGEAPRDEDPGVGAVAPGGEAGQPEEAAAAQPAPTATAEPAPREGQPAVAETEAVAGDPTDPPTDGAAAPAGAGASPAAPTPPTAAEVAGALVETAEAWGTLWAAGDYDGLYDLLSEDAQGTIKREEFAERYGAIGERAGLTAVALTVTGEPNLQQEVPVRVEYTSSVVGEFGEDNRIPLVKERDAWKVRWDPTLIFRDLGEGSCVRLEALPVPRGSILDRNGKVLAEDGEISQVGVVPAQIEDEGRVLAELSELLGISQDDIKAAYADAADPNWFMPVKDVSAADGQKLRDGAADLKGVQVKPLIARVYPYGKRAAHVTGYLTVVNAEDLDNDETGTLAEGDRIGRAGIEAGADEVLRGTAGAKLFVAECETGAERAAIKERKAAPGKDVVLTIDVDFQIEVDKAVGDGVEGGERGGAVVLDPRNGEVLAMVSHPTYDPNGFVLGFSEEDGAKLGDERQTPLINRATYAAYPTGSIFKAITFAAAMTHLGYEADTTIPCPAQYTLPGDTSGGAWNDWVVENGVAAQGDLTLHQALVQSCNTVFYELGVQLDNKGQDLLPDMVRAFGLGAPTGIPYFPEIAGTVPDPDWKLETVGDYWATGDAINLSIGQGFLAATPIQMANAYAAIANGGTLFQPYIVEFTQDAEGGDKERVGEPTEIRDVGLDRRTVRALHQALRDQTSNEAGVGSAKVFGDFRWQIAGKTGTAQDERTGRASAQRPHSWFAAFGPYGDETTIASAVLIENVGEGVSFAAPITKAIYTAYLDSDLPEIRP